MDNYSSCDTICEVNSPTQSAIKSSNHYAHIFPAVLEPNGILGGHQTHLHRNQASLCQTLGQNFYTGEMRITPAPTKFQSDLGALCLEAHTFGPGPVFFKT
eukprot:210371-Amphidinium_carterae.1